MLSIFRRPPLDASMRAYNELMLIAPTTGAFTGIDGARLAKDGYIEFDCEFCQEGPIVATMVKVPYYSTAGDLYDVRSMTSGAHVAIGELVLCPQCNVRNRGREAA